MPGDSVDQNLESKSILSENTQEDTRNSSECASKSRGSPLLVVELLPGELEQRKHQTTPEHKIARENFLHTEPMDSEDSEDFEYSSYLESGMLSSSPKTDCFSVDSGSPKSEDGGRWKSYLNVVPEVILCSWCKNVCKTEEGQDSSTLSSLCIDNRQYCSEVCFNSSRRASFKKAKVCDWCQQIRPTVSYEDLTDGSQQLQFCGETCLNKYKMSIFMHETKVHMQLHPHINELQSREQQSLITPDLWLKDCSRTSIKSSNAKQIKTKSTKQSRKSPNTEASSDNRNTSSPPCFLQPRTEPTASYDTDEPMNLSTSNIRKSSQPASKRKMPIINNEGNIMESKTRASITIQATKCNAKPDTTSTAIPPDETKERNMDETHRASIRVRRLEENISQEETDAHEERAPPSYLQSFSPFNNMLLGARAPFMPTGPQLIPGPDMTTPPILQQLLLSNQNMLRFPGIRPPILFPGPQPMPLQHPLPSAESSSFRNQGPKSTNVLPLSVMVPLPFPIPIPIPIPIPVPILDLEKQEIKNALKLPQNNEENCQQIPTSIVDSNTLHIGQPTTSSKSPVRKTNEKKTQSFKSELLPTKDSNSHSEKRIGRRSILKFTSDIYEIEGDYISGASDLENSSNIPARSTPEDSVEPPSLVKPEPELGSSRRKKRKFTLQNTENSSKRKRIAA